MSARTAATPSSSLPTLRYPIGETVVPGDRIGNIRQVQAGPGTHVQPGGHIYATLVGSLQVRPVEQTYNNYNNDETTTAAATALPSFICSVEESSNSTNHSSAFKPLATSRVLHVGQLVLGKVLRITPQNALVNITVLEGVGSPGVGSSSSSSSSSFPWLEGAIRMEDVRGGASEQVDLGECFQPGDIVACKVISLGDARRYFLTTAETELGVIRATSKTSGLPMIPISWKEMQCPETFVKESRKCAKPGGGGDLPDAKG